MKPCSPCTYYEKVNGKPPDQCLATSEPFDLLVGFAVKVGETTVALKESKNGMALLDLVHLALEATKTMKLVMNYPENHPIIIGALVEDCLKDLEKMGGVKYDEARKVWMDICPPGGRLFSPWA